MEKAIVLLSGGQDSTTCLFWAIERFGKCDAVFVDYGQRHISERESSFLVAGIAGVEFHELSFFVDSASALTSNSSIRPFGGIADSECDGGLPTTYVPARNIILLSLAASKAIELGAKNIVIGVCQADYSGYPDCRDSFVRKMEEAVNEGSPSSCRKISIHAPLMNLTKKQTVELAASLGDKCWGAVSKTTTCYNGNQCGVCPACLLRESGFSECGISDPAKRRSDP